MLEQKEYFITVSIGEIGKDMPPAYHLNYSQQNTNFLVIV